MNTYFASNSDATQKKKGILKHRSSFDNNDEQLFPKDNDKYYTLFQCISFLIKVQIRSFFVKI